MANDKILKTCPYCGGAMLILETSSRGNGNAWFKCQRENCQCQKELSIAPLLNALYLALVTKQEGTGNIDEWHEDTPICDVCGVHYREAFGCWRCNKDSDIYRGNF